MMVPKFESLITMSLYLAVFVIAGSVLRVCAQEVDLTLEPEASGSIVVRAVISKFDAAGVELFSSDHRLLRRIAYVESKDGTHANTYRVGYDGGIWQVDESVFEDTKDINTYPELVQKHDAVEIEFGIIWSEVNWGDLRKPLYSALAARLFLSIIPEDIPLAKDIEDQGQYWKEHYSTEIEVTVEIFVEVITELEADEGCRVNSDLIFVLDSSGSIGETSYQLVREFVYNFASSLDIGPDDNQVGVIIFSDDAQDVFNLSEHNDKPDLLQAINSIPYLSGSTNTAAALRMLIGLGFTTDAGARLDSDSVFRLAIVMTDGMSNTNSEDTPFAAAAVHDFEPGILVYVIGVTDNVNQAELEQIATTPEFIDQLEFFERRLFDETQEQRSYEICFTVSVPSDVGNSMSGTIAQDKQARFQLPIPEEGVTIHLCIEDGHIVLYASTAVPNPNEAYYQWKLDCIDCESCELFVNPDDPEVIPNDPPRSIKRTSIHKRAANDTGLDYSNSTLYISIEGLGYNNSFTLNTTVGDATTPHESEQESTESDKTMLWIIIGSSGGGGILLLFTVVCCVCAICMKVRRKDTAHYATVEMQDDYYS